MIKKIFYCIILQAAILSAQQPDNSWRVEIPVTITEELRWSDTSKIYEGYNIESEYGEIVQSKTGLFKLLGKELDLLESSLMNDSSLDSTGRASLMQNALGTVSLIYEEVSDGRVGGVFPILDVIFTEGHWESYQAGETVKFTLTQNSQSKFSEYLSQILQNAMLKEDPIPDDLIDVVDFNFDMSLNKIEYTIDGQRNELKSIIEGTLGFLIAVKSL